MITRSSFTLGIFAGGVLHIAQFGARDRLAGIVKEWSILQQIHSVSKLGGKMANFCPDCSDVSLRMFPKSSEEFQIDSGVPARHDSQRGLHSRSASRVKQSIKLATCSLKVPSNILAGPVG